MNFVAPILFVVAVASAIWLATSPGTKPASPEVHTEVEVLSVQTTVTATSASDSTPKPTTTVQTTIGTLEAPDDLAGVRTGGTYTVLEHDGKLLGAVPEQQPDELG